MLAQHIITNPVFESLFMGNNFVDENPVSRAMQKILNLIYKSNKAKYSTIDYYSMDTATLLPTTKRLSSTKSS